MNYSLAAKEINEKRQSGKGILIYCNAKDFGATVTWVVNKEKSTEFFIDEKGIHSEIESDQDDWIHIKLDTKRKVVYDKDEDTYCFTFGNGWVMVTIL